MSHPLAFIPKGLRKPLFITLLVWTLILMAVSQVINAPLQNPIAPASIVSFELARTPSNSQALIDSWSSRTQLFAAFGLGFDYLFMPAYAFTISLACLLSAGRHNGWFGALGAWLGWGLFLAAIFDAIENIGLWNSLQGNANSDWPQVAFWCASLKFTLILLGIAYGVLGWIISGNKTEPENTP
jgi:hypothetical protein